MFCQAQMYKYLGSLHIYTYNKNIFRSTSNKVASSIVTVNTYFRLLEKDYVVQLLNCTYLR